METAEAVLMKLTEYIETMSPELWAILIRQVYSNAFGSLISGVLILVLGIAGIWIVRYCIVEFKNDDTYSSEADIFAVAVGLFTVPITIWGIGNIYCFVKYLVNPEYYAIQMIINMLSGQQ